MCVSTAKGCAWVSQVQLFLWMQFKFIIHQSEGAVWGDEGGGGDAGGKFNSPNSVFSFSREKKKKASSNWKNILFMSAVFALSDAPPPPQQVKAMELWGLCMKFHGTINIHLHWSGLSLIGFTIIPLISLSPPPPSPSLLPPDQSVV